MTCHKEYTESLQAPPGPMKPAGFSKACPEKPRSVSLWPGLAGLKACRLSAGRPGRLRTLSPSFHPLALVGSSLSTSLNYFLPPSRLPSLSFPPLLSVVLLVLPFLPYLYFAFSLKVHS